MRFTANVWVYRDVLYRPGTPFEAPSKLSDAWTEVDGPETIIDQSEDFSDRPRRGRPPKGK